MADNNTNPWPPAPPESSEKAIKPPANVLAGWISLVMALIGVLALIVPPFIAAKFGATPMVAVPVEAVWWVATIVLGIVGRRSVPGKIALGIILVVIILVTVIVIWMVASPPPTRVSAPTVPSLPSR